MGPPLPAKEASLFKSIVKHYELKSYKKGLRAADQVLKKFPEHGETMAMKGLLLNCMDKKQEAYELARQGVKLDIKSQVCWHVYGLLYRSDRDYMQAIKCYRGALRYDPDNVKILRDLSMLQVQLRLLPDFLDTRQKLLALKPTNRMHWFTFAAAHHLLKHYGQAIGVVEAYEKSIEGSDEPTREPYEYSEMLMYKNQLYEEGGRTQQALDHLDRVKDKVVDGVSWKQKRAQLLLQLHRFDEARDVYLELLKRNPEQFGWHAGLQAAELRTSMPTERWLTAKVTPATEATLRDLYEDLQKRFPRSQACKRLPLDFARDPAYFASTFNEYVQPFVRKGVPSLFADLKPLCEEGSFSRVAFGELLAGWLVSLEGAGTFPGSSEREPPSTIMWVRVLAAQYYDCCGEASKALEQINLAIRHTPTCLDLYLFKARVYKHAGDLRSAARWMDEARKMDLADRYLNTKATRYMLRADQVAQAESTIALFTKDGDTGSNLLDMQCMWYELECGASYLRISDYGRALKNFMHVEKHFNDFAEDQFDFHTYCIRKMTLRAYIGMVRLEDSMLGHKFYVTAACGIIETYMRIVNKPQADSVAAEEAGDGMSAAERKKQESKRRKAEAKAKAEADVQAKKDLDAKAPAKGKKGPPVKEKLPDEDPDGKALAQVEAPLNKAAVYMRTLLLHAPGELRVQVLACELAMARSKWLLALRALRKALGICPDDPRTHRCIVRFLHATKTNAALPKAVAKVVARQEEELGLARHRSLCMLNEAYLSRAQTNAAAQLAYAEMLALISPEAAAKARQVLLDLDLASASLAVCKEAAQLLGVDGVLADTAAAAQFRHKAHARYPHATVFGGGANDDVPGCDAADLRA